VNHRHRLARISGFAALLLCALIALPGCGKSDSLDGLYAASSGQATVEFKDGKAYVTLGAMATDPLPYEVKDNTITIHAGGIPGDLVLTKNKDGTLEGPFGIMRKKKA